MVGDELAELARRVRRLRRAAGRDDPETFAVAVEGLAEDLERIARTAGPAERTPTTWRAPERQADDDPERERRLAALLAEQERQLAELRAKLAAAQRRRRGRRGGRRAANRADVGE